MSGLPPRLRPGDIVFVRGMPFKALEVVETSDQVLVTLGAENGATLKVGRLSVVKVERPPERVCEEVLR